MQFQYFSVQRIFNENIANNKSKIDALRIITKTIQEKLEEKNKKIEDLDNLLDDQVNRGCRKTLIIRGLEMKEEERTWSE